MIISAVHSPRKDLIAAGRRVSSRIRISKPTEGENALERSLD